MVKANPGDMSYCSIWERLTVNTEVPQASRVLVERRVSASDGVPTYAC